MNAVKRICAFYSRGPHYVRMLKHLRTVYPEATITALVPPGYPDEPLTGLAHKRVEMGQAKYTFRDIRAFRALLHQIHSGHYDLLAVMFASPRLRILARLSGIPERYSFSPDGRFAPLKGSLLRSLAGAAYRKLRGRLRYAYLYYVVHFQHVGRKDS